MGKEKEKKKKRERKKKIHAYQERFLGGLDQQGSSPLRTSEAGGNCAQQVILDFLCEIWDIDDPAGSVRVR